MDTFEQPDSDYSSSSVEQGATSPASAANHTPGQQYLIASLKHTNKYHEHITFWGPNYRGYVIAITDDRVGRYSADFIENDCVLNDGESCIAIPEDAVKALLSPTPYYAASNGKAHPFYDIPGPVVDNTRANWNKLIAASLPRKSEVKPKPQIFRGPRRSFAIDADLLLKAGAA